MNTEIIKKLKLIQTNVTNGMSFVTDLKFYKYGAYRCIAGNIDGTINESGLICFFNSESGSSVQVTEDFLLKVDISVIDAFLAETLGCSLSHKIILWAIEWAKSGHNKYAVTMLLRDDNVIKQVIKGVEGFCTCSVGTDGNHVAEMTFERCGDGIITNA